MVGRWPFLWDVRYRTPHATYPDGGAETRKVPSLFGLAPGGACRAGFVAETAVRSYRTISTLPDLAAVGGLISVALSLESPPPDIIRHRVSVEPGLSSSPSREGPAAIRPSDAFGTCHPARRGASRVHPELQPLKSISCSSAARMDSHSLSAMPSMRAGR